MSSIRETPIKESEKLATNENEREPSETHRIHIVTTKDEDGRYSTVALNLPGAGSCGDTKEESIENAKEAIKGVLESHKEDGEPIPWKDSTMETNVAGEQAWIVVNA